MKTSKVTFILIISCLILGSSVRAQYLYITKDTTINLPMTVDSVRIIGGGNLVADDSITVLGDMFIQPGGKVSHSPYPTNNGKGLILHVVGTLHIDSTSIIEANYKGLRGAGPSACGAYAGETYDEGGNVICGSSGSSGGSYGGVGGTGATAGTVGAIYGNVEIADRFGSGGGAEYAPYNRGGHGGGLIRITAGKIVINGEIHADGESSYSGNCAAAYSRPGAGSGGGISIIADTIIGSAQAVITANGGMGSPCTYGGGLNAGGGGGGRIVMLADNQSGYLGSITAYGGYCNTSNNVASSGTIYKRNSRNDSNVPGELTFTNRNVKSSFYSSLRTNLPEFQSIILKEGATLSVISDSIVVRDSVVISSNGEFQLQMSELEVNNPSDYDVHLFSTGKLTLLNGSNLSIDRMEIKGGSLYTNVSVAFNAPYGLKMEGSTGSVILRDSSVLSLPNFDTTNIIGGTLDIGSIAGLNVQNDIIIVGNGVTLIKDGRFNGGLPAEEDQIGMLTILPGGRMAHSARSHPGLQINTDGTLWIQQNGKIDVSKLGLSGAGPSVCGAYAGETYDESGNVICGSSGSSGGSYGGVGGTGATSGVVGSAYGTVEVADRLGSGGGAEYAPYNRGGNGGGLVRITAAKVIADGEIHADGESSYSGNCAAAYSRPGAGSGGGISIIADTIIGSAQAVLTANGGMGSPCSYGGGLNAGGGGGGRIVMLADDQSNYLGSITAYGGYCNTSNNVASSGTIYRRNSRNDSNILGELIIDNNKKASYSYTPWKSTLSKLQILKVINNGSLEMSSEFKIEGRVILTNGGKVGR